MERGKVRKDDERLEEEFVVYPSLTQIVVALANALSHNSFTRKLATE